MEVVVWTALWSVDTLISRRGPRPENAVAALSQRERVALLGRVVEQAYIFLAKDLIRLAEEIGKSGTKWYLLFVAPEYLFARSDTAHAITQAEKREVVRLLAALSLRYPELILVPGSIAWKKPAVRPASELRKRDPETGRRTGPEKEESRVSKFMQRIDWDVHTQSAMAEHRVERHLHAKLADKTHSLEQKKRLQSAEYRQALLTAVLDDLKRERKDKFTQMAVNLSTAPERCFVARNTAYAFHNGREVARYHKRGNFHEVVPDESDGGYVIFEPGGGPEGNGDTFDLDGVTFGIEICLDHNMGYLSQTSSARPDIQILMSARVTFVPEHLFVPEHCYLVHACSDVGGTKIWGNRTVPLKSGGYGLIEYDLDEEAAEVGTLKYGRLRFEKASGAADYLTLEDWIGKSL